MIEASKRSALLGTQIALVGVAVPGLAGCLVIVVAMPSDEVLGDVATRVHVPDQLVDALAVQFRSTGAGAAFEMVRHASGVGEGSFAKGAHNAGGPVCARVEMLDMDGIVRV